jgi:Zn-dependent peptidase ImmA (M78 family)
MTRAEREAHQLIALYHEYDPEKLAEKMGVLTILCDLPESVEGFYHCYRGHPIIYLADRLPPCRRRAVCGHELGHAILHGDINSLLLDDTDEKLEREADLFSAALLLSERPEGCCDVQSLVQATGLPETAIRRVYDML